MPHPSSQSPTIAIQRAYDDAGPHDGYRVLVDRVWPRGRTKEALNLDEWLRDLAPSTELRKWFGHDPQRWTEFQQRYRAELESDEQQTRMRQLFSAAGSKRITLVYSAKDEEHNQALVLRDVLVRLHKTAEK